MLRKLNVLIASFACAILMIGLSSAKATTETPNVSPPQTEIPVTITDKRNRPMKIESLSPTDRERVERFRKNARNLLDSEGGPNNLKIQVGCECCPLSCWIKVSWSSAK